MIERIHELIDRVTAPGSFLGPLFILIAPMTGFVLLGIFFKVRKCVNKLTVWNTVRVEQQKKRQEEKTRIGPMAEAILKKMGSGCITDLIEGGVIYQKVKVWVTPGITGVWVKDERDTYRKVGEYDDPLTKHELRVICDKAVADRKQYRTQEIMNRLA